MATEPTPPSTEPTRIVGVRFRHDVRDTLFDRAAASGERPSDVVRRAVAKELWPDATDEEIAALAST